MKKSTGFKEMLRDRCPQTLNFALKWCKAKDKWIDYIYYTHIKRYPQNRRSSAVKMVLGIKNIVTRREIYDHYRYVQFNKNITWDSVLTIPNEALKMSFGQTIDYETLYEKDIEEYKYWKWVEQWVNWFRKNFIYIENCYKMTCLCKDEEEAKIRIITSYLATLLPTEDDEEETAQKKLKYVNKLADYLVRCCNKSV